MAIVELTIRDAKDGQFFPVCMRCGAGATAYQDAMIYWRPWWVAALFYPSMAVYFIPYLILDSLFGRRAALRAPVCEDHRNHWRWRLLVLFGLFAVSILSIVIGMVVTFDLAERLHHSRPFTDLAHGLAIAGMLLFFSGYAGLLAVAIASPIFKRTAIYAKKISKDRITLVGVSPAFLAAQESAGQSAGAESSSSWRKRSENVIAAELRKGTTESTTAHRIQARPAQD
ncbi:MAG TPA: hypothetical protein VKE94_22130 [Gemmataceae bacterium]|nr:hypothetical protein [Gemmataceae bacterium]